MSDRSIEPLGCLLVLVGLAMLLALRLVYSRHRNTGADQVHLALRAIGWVLLAVGVLGALQMVLGPGVGAMFWFVTVMASGNMTNRYRAAERNALLWVLAVAADKQMPLASSIEAFAAEWGGQFGRRSQGLAQLLRAGVTLPDALDRLRALVPGTARVAARVGVEAGVLGSTLREAAAVHRAHSPNWQALASKAQYLFCVMLVAQAVAVFMAIKIAPALQQIMGTFGTELPPLTEVVLETLDAPWLIETLSLALCVQIVVLAFITLHSLGWLPWDPPLLNRLTWRIDAAVILRSLAWMVERQRPLGSGLLTVARSYPKGWIRRRLRAADRHMAEGADWCDALRRQRLLGRADAAVLKAAERVGNLAWAMREMADSGERRLALRLQSIVQILYPLVIMLLGLLTFLFVTGFFLPVIQIIQSFI